MLFFHLDKKKVSRFKVCVNLWVSRFTWDPSPHVVLILVVSIYMGILHLVLICRSGIYIVYIGTPHVVLMSGVQDLHVDPPHVVLISGIQDFHGDPPPIPVV